MSNENMKIWDAVCKTDPKFTKKVSQRGGFTTIDAYYQIQQATELWGPYGSSWGLSDIVYSYRENIVILAAKFRYPGGVFEIGNSISFTVIKKAGKPAEPDDEFIKKIETNTISKALSRLGFSADVFVGKFDDARYVAEINKEFGNPEPTKAAPPIATSIPKPGATPAPSVLKGVPPMPGGSLQTQIPKP